MQSLSEIPSEAVSQLLDDLEWVENNPKLRINMEEWGSLNDQGEICEVCLGGAFMHRRGELEILHDPCQGDNISPAAFAGNSLRAGNLYKFIDYIVTDPLFSLKIRQLIPKSIYYIGSIAAIPGHWVEYEEDPDKFKQQLVFLAEAFEQAEELIENGDI